MITIEDVRNAEQMKAGDERRIKGIITAVLDLFDNQTARKWRREVDYKQLIVLGDDSHKRKAARLWADLYPIESLTVKQWGKTEQVADAVTLEVGTDYQIIPDVGVVLRTRCDIWEYFVQLTITGGYVAPNAPGAPSEAAIIDEAVREALIQQVLFTNTRWQGQRRAVNSESFEIGSTQFLRGDLHPVFQRMVTSRRRRARVR